jgi:hypothetical protein
MNNNEQIIVIPLSFVKKKEESNVVIDSYA